MTAHPRVLPGMEAAPHGGASPVVLRGGRFYIDTLHKSLSPFERFWRRQFPPSAFGNPLRPSSTINFEIGAFTVPNNMALMIFDFRPDVYRFSGLDPYDVVPVETRSLSTQIGFDLKVSSATKGDVQFSLLPRAPQLSQLEAFIKPGSTSKFGSALQPPAPNASPFSRGIALQPQRPQRYGALNTAFTIYARSGEPVQAEVNVFQPLTQPLAFVEYSLTGFLVPNLWMDDVLNVIRPEVTSGGGPR